MRYKAMLAAAVLAAAALEGYASYLQHRRSTVPIAHSTGPALDADVVHGDHHSRHSDVLRWRREHLLKEVEYIGFDLNGDGTIDQIAIGATRIDRTHPRFNDALQRF